MKRKRYEEAGVNVNAGYEMVKRLRMPLLQQIVPALSVASAALAGCLI